MFEGYEDVVYCVNCGRRTGDRFNCPYCKKIYFCIPCLGICECKGVTKDLRYIMGRMEDLYDWNLVIRGLYYKGVSLDDRSIST